MTNALLEIVQACEAMINGYGHEDCCQDLPKTRKEAILVGAKRYFTGKPCINGHVAPKKTANHTCIVCQHRNHRRKDAAGVEIMWRGRMQ